MANPSAPWATLRAVALRLHFPFAFPAYSGQTAAVDHTPDPPAPETAKAPAAEEAAPLPKAAERVDDEGLPLDRAPTLDDVRGADGGGRIIAIGCTALVIAVVFGFWALRALVFR